MVDGRTDGRTTDGRRLDGYTLSSPCEPNGSGELKWEIIQSLIYRILPKIDQVIYTLESIYDANIMALAKAVLEIFCSHIMSKTEKGDNSVMDLENITQS